MSAVIKIIPQQDWEVIKQYLYVDEGMIFVPEQVKNQLPEEEQELLNDYQGDYVDYDFGGGADIWIDIAWDANCYALRTVLDQMKQTEGADFEMEQR